MLTIIIEEEQDGQRLDKALSALSGISRNHILDSLNSDKILDFKNRIIKKASLIVRTGQEFKVLPYDPIPIIANISSPDKLNVVYEDEFLLIVNKPTGQASHPSAGHLYNTLLDDAINYLQHTQAPITTFNGLPALINRLDRDTSGLIMIAKDEDTHNHLKQQFSDRTIVKIYQAQVDNYDLLPDMFYLESFIGPSHKQNNLMESYEQKIYTSTPERYADLQHSLKSKITENHLEIINNNQQITLESEITTYSHLKHLYNATRFKYGFLECMKHSSSLLCFPHTGRQHQIRVQLSTQKSPVIGDILYSQNHSKPLQLSSVLVNFFHPKKSQFITVFSPSS